MRFLINFLYRLSGWYVGAWLVILVAALITNSSTLIKNNAWISIPALMFIPLYYLNKYLNKKT